MNIKGIHHNVYRCRDSEETRRFYEGFLGLPLAAATEVVLGGKTRALHTFYALPSGSFLAFFEVPKQPFEFKQQDALDLHIALEIDATELDAWLEKARLNDVANDGISDHEVVRSIYFRDPNGYLIELTAKMPAHDRLNDPPRARQGLDRWQAAKSGSCSLR